jgi:hypothetical protein
LFFRTVACFETGATLRIAALAGAFFVFFAAMRLEGARFAAPRFARRELPALAARAGDFRDVRVVVLFFAFDRLLMRGISFLRLMSDSPCANAARCASVCAALFSAAESFENRTFCTVLRVHEVCLELERDLQ